MKKPARLEDIDLPKKILRADPPLDKNISNLVKALCAANYLTTGSCEGHITSPRRASAPWVNLFVDERLHSIIREYNNAADIKWIILGNGRLSALRPAASALSHEGLRDMQIEVENLAQYIFENHATDETYEQYFMARVYEGGNHPFLSNNLIPFYL